MHLLMEAMDNLGAALLPVAAGLLFEELTYGGLVRLLLAPWPGIGNHSAPCDTSSSLRCKRNESNNKARPLTQAD
jgi:hypothetical protein